MAKKKSAKKPVKVKEIIPCVCTDHTPNFGDSSLYGMPQLTVYMSKFSKRTRFYYSAFCPKCGRGSKLGNFKTPDEALANWNRVQRNCYSAAHREIKLFDYTGEEDNSENNSNDSEFIKKIKPEQIQTNMKGTTLEIYLDGRILCEISDGNTDPDFIDDVLYGMGYEIIEDKAVE